MRTLPEIEQLVKEDWPSEPVAVELLRVVSALHDDETHYITIPLLVQLLDETHHTPLSVHAGDRAMIALVYRWSEYFASERMGLLDPHFELLRDDDTTAPLDALAVLEALKTGSLYDPDTGNPVADWKANVVPYYSATKLLKAILGEHR